MARHDGWHLYAVPQDDEYAAELSVTSGPVCYSYALTADELRGLARCEWTGMGVRITYREGEDFTVGPQIPSRAISTLLGWGVPLDRMIAAARELVRVAN